MAIQDPTGGAGATSLIIAVSALGGAIVKTFWEWITHSADRTSSFEQRVNERVELVIKGYEKQISYFIEEIESLKNEIVRLRGELRKFEEELGDARQELQRRDSAKRVLGDDPNNF